MKYRASFVVAAKDCQAYIAQALHSCLSQTEKRIEVVAVNDGSKDSTGRVMDYIAQNDKRLRVIHLPENVGRSAARNIGIEAATAPVILILDGDDISLDQRVAHTLNHLKKNPTADIVYGKFQVINEIGDVLENVGIQPFNIEVVKNSGFTYIGHSTMAFKREVFDKLKYSDGEWSSLGIDDWKFQIDAYKAGFHIEAIPKTLSQYRFIEKTRDEKRILELKKVCLSEI